LESTLELMPRARQRGRQGAVRMQRAQPSPLRSTPSGSRVTKKTAATGTSSLCCPAVAAPPWWCACVAVQLLLAAADGHCTLVPHDGAGRRRQQARGGRAGVGRL
jgi:hypothetical protein